MIRGHVTLNPHTFDEDTDRMMKKGRELEFLERSRNRYRKPTGKDPLKERIEKESEKFDYSILTK